VFSIAPTSDCVECTLGLLEKAYLLDEEHSVEFRDAVSLTIARLRCGLQYRDMSYRTGHSKSTLSRLFRWTLAALSSTIEVVFGDPRDPNLVDKFRTRWFIGEFSSTGHVIDGLKIPVTRGGTVMTRKCVYNNYKNDYVAQVRHVYVRVCV